MLFGDVPVRAVDFGESSLARGERRGYSVARDGYGGVSPVRRTFPML